VEFAIAMAGVIVRQAEGSLRAARAAWKDAQRPSTVRHYSRARKGGSNRGDGVYGLQRAVKASETSGRWRSGIPAKHRAGIVQGRQSRAIPA
jgi:hypothetical protein